MVEVVKTSHGFVFYSRAISLSVLITISNTLNQVMFYLSHLYEISLQAGQNLLRLNEGRAQQIIAAYSKMFKHESFYKNPYTMFIPSHRTALFLWTLPSLTVSLVTQVIKQDFIKFLVFCGYYKAFLLAANYKAFPSSILACSDFFVVLAAMVGHICFLAMFFMSVTCSAIVAIVVIAGFL